MLPQECECVPEILGKSYNLERSA
ncbi:hypothetical protein CP061683_0532A, partial [Chlamydia psittaci 06-1683]